ncbi:MAG: tRNA (adenosine(37)-N6)-dimethylallyltransferase MiaA [Phycisphaerae bacterium]|jgi:tRNA dimethylallyltransferase|nr:tRNA (adenosine(37)-N6)-dimethylallyltransferase MiaA [Phycisphaerae bacterium]MBT5365695.1 tRNA (adenosine(37)-N6)-dimethylallyltransferase MiaA [Phycisphaerae bacterium]MBT6269735.1 tRNA (adenosine(37)-N6)-dimethylallyltransferase MiaA [Phycisphaerae bacterium]MBT6281906.1 tRNA (adenosine(37)-N6)-dimethylallyltransferase MiaA [Phycisphaerae bacterium]
MHPIVLILGPTAGGKTSLAISLANELPGGGECICADSMQVYTGMDIGTAKPTEEERAAAVHHLVDIANPSEDGFTVETWLTHANAVIEDIRNRGKWPIVVGGTNLYVQSLLFGLFDGPDCDQEKRDVLNAIENTKLQTRLRELDPEAADRIHINDKRRLVRAIEVCEATGFPLSSLQSQWGKPMPREDAIIIGLNWPVKTINKRINARVKAMFNEGLLAEVEAIKENLGKQASEALGYKQILAHLRGECSLDEARERIKILTRRYAKQQRTWLRKFQILPSAHFIEMDNKGVQHATEQALTSILPNNLPI